MRSVPRRKTFLTSECWFPDHVTWAFDVPVRERQRLVGLDQDEPADTHPARARGRRAWGRLAPQRGV